MQANPLGEEYFSHDLRGDNNGSFAYVAFESASGCVFGLVTS